MLYVDVDANADADHPGELRLAKYYKNCRLYSFNQW